MSSDGRNAGAVEADTRTSRRLPTQHSTPEKPAPKEHQESSRLRQHSLQEKNEVSTTAQAPSIEYTVADGEFSGAILGPVTQHNKHHTFGGNAHLTQIENVVHHHHYASDVRNSQMPENLSASGSQTQQTGMKAGVIKLTGSMGLTIFEDQKLHGKKMIYKGEKATVGKPIPLAVKLISHSKQALREAQSLHSLDSHPNVVKIYDSGTHYLGINYVFIAMELCSPETLYDYVNKNIEPNPRQAIQHSNQIISGLEYIHDKGIAHRDLKPQNILFSAIAGFDQVKITDFGLAKDYLSDPHTTTGTAPGTFGYMAPELVKNEKPNDPRQCDIFSLGIVLAFRLTNGKHPYGKHHWEWIGNIAKGDDPDLSQIHFPNQNQKYEVLRVITKMLQNKPENRPTARDLMKDWTRNVGDFVETNTSELGKTNEEQITPSSKGHRKKVVETDEHSKQTATHIKGVSEKEPQETSDRVQSPSHLLLQQQSAMSHSPQSSDARQAIKLHRDKETARSHVPEVQKTPRSIGFIEEASGDPQRAREVQVMSSGQGHLEEIGRGDRDTERESGRIFPTDMETRIKEVGGGESSETTRQRQDGSGFIETPGMFGITEEFELVYWKDIGQLTTDPTVITKLPDSVRYHSVVAGDRCIYLVKDTTCYRYDLDNADRGLIRLGSMKHDHGSWPPAAVLNGKLYVCDKGRNCEVFTGQWSETGSLKVLRRGSRIVPHGGFLYSIGGMDETRNPLRSVEKYDPSTNTWEIIQPMNVERYNANVVVYNGKIYVWGGYYRVSWIASCECFNPLTSTWTLSTFDWWKINKPLYPFVFDNKVLSLLDRSKGGYVTIQQVPIDNECEADLIKVKLPERWALRSISAVE